VEGCGKLFGGCVQNPYFSRKGRARNGAPSGSSLDGKQKTREFPRFSANRPGGASQRQAAAHLGVKPRCVTSALANRRERYTAASNEALIALAIRLQWIEIAIDIRQDETSPPPQTW
jgi:hypothetical protein